MKSVRKEADQWTPMEEFVLSTLVGKVSYRDIALRLGRSETAVQRQASKKGFSARSEWAKDRLTRQQQAEALLALGEVELAAYALTCDEEPAERPAKERYVENVRRKRAEMRAS